MLPPKHCDRLRAQAADLETDLQAAREVLESADAKLRELQSQKAKAAQEVRDFERAINQILELAGDDPRYPKARAKGKTRPLAYRSRTCGTCGTVVEVHANTKKCPECGGLLVKPEKEDEEEDEGSGQDDEDEDDPPDDDWDEEDDEDDPPPTLPTTPTMTDKEWTTKPVGKSDARIRKGCVDCTEIVYVMEPLTICPLKDCNGRLVAAKETKGEARG